MSIKDYKKKFIELFKQLRDEHGMPKSICVSCDDICDDTGNAIESNVTCRIEF